jgi:hypothetical protein
LHSKRAKGGQALHRLCSHGQVAKIVRGRCTLPVRSRFGTRRPSPELVIDRLNEEQGEQLVSSGVAAANALGLTTQIPVQQTFLSRTRSRKRYLVGKQELILRQAPRRRYLLAVSAGGWTRRPGDSGPCLAWASAALPKLRQVLPQADATIGLPAYLLEKDIWVVWALDALGSDQNRLGWSSYPGE